MYKKIFINFNVIFYNNNSYKFVLTITIKFKLKLITFNIFYRNIEYKTLSKNNE